MAGTKLRWESPNFTSPVADFPGYNEPDSPLPTTSAVRQAASLADQPTVPGAPGNQGIVSPWGKLDRAESRDALRGWAGPVGAEYDPEKAKQLLAQAVSPNGFTEGYVPFVPYFDG